MKEKQIKFIVQKRHHFKWLQNLSTFVKMGNNSNQSEINPINQCPILRNTMVLIDLFAIEFDCFVVINKFSFVWALITVANPISNAFQRDKVWFLSISLQINGCVCFSWSSTSLLPSSWLLAFKLTVGDFARDFVRAKDRERGKKLSLA